ncbi:MAG: ABC transporter ATP-binding protein [Rhizobiales bacterium]|nr:ABC transporter ATP-binding protein [Hyphomicrobiales bacterium]
MTDRIAESEDTVRQRWGMRGTAGATIAGGLDIETVAFSVGEVHILHNVSFSVKPGEIACLLGPSGCGKTTLLRLVAGLERPEAGRILLDGQEVAGPSAFVPPERRKIGLMFQDFALFPHMTVLKNVAFGLRDLGRKEAKGIALHALERVGLASRRQDYPHMLSGGEQQRVALARALVPRPQVLLLDEPFSGLDERLREQVRDETLALLRETRATVMLVTHDPEEAMGIADRILMMRRGRLVQEGTPHDVFTRPADPEATRFFSTVNELWGKVKAGNIDTPLGTFAAGNLTEGEPALVMIRPQGLRLARGQVGIEGYVLEARFMGETTRCSVLFKGIEEPLTAVIGGSQRPEKGHTAQFKVDDDQVHVFAQGGQRPI